MVYGDSHAEHFTKALNRVFGDEYLFYMITNGSCFMGEEVLVSNVGNERDCTAALDKLHTLRGKSVYAVIRAQRWHAYGGADENGIRRLVEDAILAARLNPKRTIIVGSTADVPFDCEVSNYYSMPLVRKKACKAEPDYKDLNRLFVATTKALNVPPGVSFVYPYEIVCPGERCEMINGNISKYSDTHHLTEEGAMLVMPEIGKALNSKSLN